MTANKKSESRRRVRPGPISPAEAEQREELIVRIATEEFLTKGFRGATLEVIAKRCRIGRRTLYAIYESKENLFSHIAAASIPKFRYELMHALNMDRDLREVIRHVVELIVESAKNRRAVSILNLVISVRTSFPGIAQMAFEHSFEVMRPLGEFLRAKARKGALTERQALLRAYHLMCMANGGFGFLLADPHILYPDPQGWVDSVTESFVDGFPAA